LLERVTAINIETMETAAATQNLDRTPAKRGNAMGARIPVRITVPAAPAARSVPDHSAFSRARSERFREG
jgi:hypothetical protein